MVTVKADGNSVLEISLLGEGQYLHTIQRALLLGIEELGSQKERSGSRDYQEAVIALSGLLRECMLSESQTNVGMGFKPYASDKKNRNGLTLENVESRSKRLAASGCQPFMILTQPIGRLFYC